MANVKIKFNRSVCINDLLDESGNVAQPRVRMVELSTLRGTALVAQVDLDTVIPIPVPDIAEPPMPARSANMSDRWFQHLCDVAFEAALVRLREADKLRARLNHHINRGTIAIVEDETGFLSRADALDPAAAAVADKKKADAESIVAQKAKAK